MPAFEPDPLFIIKITGPAATNKTDVTVRRMPRILNLGFLARTHFIDIRFDFCKVIRIDIVEPSMENIFARVPLVKSEQLEHGFIGEHSGSLAIVNFDSPKSNAHTLQDINSQRYRFFFSHRNPNYHLIKIIPFIIKIPNQ